ncbi:MAG: TRAP transporter substrate-binding protein DctP [Xanthobacteraceae bacterium]
MPIFCGTISSEAAGWFRMEVAGSAQGPQVPRCRARRRVYQKVGASVTLLPGGELFQALEKGVLDGTEFSLPTVDDQLGFYKVAKFYMLPGWHQPSTNKYLYINAAVWDKLNATTKALIETTCTAAVTISLAKAEALQGKVLEKFEKEGVKLVKVSPELLKTFQNATKEVMTEESAKDPMFKKIYDSMTAFQKQNQKWTEYGYLPRDFK